MTLPASPEPGTAAPRFHGLPVRRLSNGLVRLDVLAGAGPRIVRLGIGDRSENLLAETPDAGWETPHGRYELFGGHRLWFAPEIPDRVAIPDGSGLRLDEVGGALRLTGRPDPGTGIVRSIEVRLDPGRAAVELRHELCNAGERPIELAPWPITQLPLGGVVLLPDDAATDDHGVQPNRLIALWPYSSWDDPRLQPGDGLLLVRAAAGPRLKIGHRNVAGWAAYLRRGTVLIRRFDPAADRVRPDLGCTVEAYCDDRFVEVETLGPLVTLGPGESAVHEERWEIVRVGEGPGADPRRVADGIRSGAIAA